MNVENYTKKIYNLYGEDYQRSRDQKKPERLYNEFLEVPCMVNAVGNIKNKRLLDVGCGAGVHIKKYVQKGAIVKGVDISETMIKLARKNCPAVEFSVGNISELHFKDGSFDIVTASLIIDYVSNLKKAFLEISRVLKKGGLFYYSDMSPISLTRERKEDSNFKYNAIGVVQDKNNNRLTPLGNHWKESILEYEMVPGMLIKTYKRLFRTHLKAIVDSKFELVDFIDCKPIPAFKKYDTQAYEIFTKFPLFSIYVCRKKLN